MNQSSIHFFKSTQHNIEFIYLRNSTLSFPEHNHISVYTIGLVLDGTIQFKYQDHNNTTIQYSANSTFMVSPYEPHSMYANDYYEMISLCIDKDFIMNNSYSNTATIIEMEAKQLIAKNLLPKHDLTKYNDELAKIYSDIASHLMPCNNGIEKLKVTLEQHPETECSLEHLSREVCISKYYLIREFKKTVGLTPHKFQIQNRIRKAQRLIIKNDSLTEIALAIGFYDQSHFIKHFKNIVGITPTEYKFACIQVSDCKEELAKGREEFSK